ncbi:histidine kinase [Xylanimonas cellulosilytica DSM 15894]|uniref:histidine kinase n=1 Tax=Xylanimonas cellulosilytica (strain DSM 15894 / JCM 12276 / CECT 5975 / KCTC 9989 / LMG 20990 / NBRC 107835 / XIL07) TaxID=446471 RepID=D1BWF6_XYLCX|nr:HAMP domain-containing sensor histidine kinase [Xylanimonas cellulosilytica]ACZ31501.1 histidine kinase [Xylanimonas cellulosilytica DSM 15894]
MALRPLDPLRSLKMKLGVLVVAAVTFAAAMTWLGLRVHLGPSRTFPLVIVLSLVLTQVLARGMTSPLREMTAAAEAMAAGHYDQRVTATSRDEVGALAAAFNQMAEDLESSDRTRRDLIANVSHELRTPVAALQAQLENMVDGVTEPTPATLELSLAQTERLTRLVTYLLDLSRVEAGASALTISELAVGDLLEECAQSLSMVEAVKNLRYVVDVTPSDLVLEADAERLRQIVVNLLQNAIRHSPPGGEIRLDAYPEGDDVVIEVADDGPGIAPEDRDRVFERFARGKVTASGGTGIGLAIVRWAVDLHGGQVAVVDSPGGAGATMRLVLPARAHPAPGVTTTDADA